MNRLLLAALMIVLIVPSLQAVVAELVPKVGFAFQGSHDLAGPHYDRLRLEDASVLGLSLGYLNDEGGQLDLSWSRSNTTGHLDQAEGLPVDSFDLAIDQIHINGLFMQESGAFQPFGILGAGVTHFSADRHTDHTRFSFVLGGGLKWLWNDYIGLRFEGKWIPVLAPEGMDLFCPDSGIGGCPSMESNSYISQALPFIHTFEFTTGLMLRI